MSQHEAELRGRLAGDNVDIVEIMTRFLAATDARAYADGKPGEPDLSWFEREFMRDNVERYHQERIKRLSIVDLVVGMVLAERAPDYALIDMSAMPDRELINATIGPDGDSACAELLKRANAKCITVADFIKDVLAPGTRRPPKGSSWAFKDRLQPGIVQDSVARPEIADHAPLKPTARLWQLGPVERIGGAAWSLTEAPSLFEFLKSVHFCVPCGEFDRD